jgi:hypothetical protein
MFLSIIYFYIRVNLDQYQNRISVIANATVFGLNPQQEFQKFIENAQAEALTSAMSNIQTTSEEVNTNSYRLDDKTQRLNKQISMDITNQTGKKITDLGKTIGDNIGGILNNIKKSLSQFTVKSSMSNGAVKSTQRL